MRPSVMPYSSLALAVLLAAPGVPPVAAQRAAVQLSPAQWQKAEADSLLQREGAGAQQGPAVEASRGIVVGTSHPFAVHAGLQALKQGGTAADAVLTTALAQITLNAGSAYSFAGFMTLVYYDAATGKVSSMNAGFNTVKGETDPLTIPVMGTPSGRTALVPGFFAGVEAAHQRFGKLPFATLFEPAIYLAEDGFPVTRGLAGAIARRKDVLTRLPATRAVFAKDNGELYGLGDRFRQPALGATLRRVAREGARYIYLGEWARHFVDAVRADSGKMTLADLAAYRVLWPEPVRTRYRDYEVYAAGLPTFGGVNTLEALNLYQAANLARLGHYTESPEALYWMIQISRVPRLVGLPGAGSGVPPALTRESLGDLDLSPESRVRPETARRLWQKMQEPGWAKLQQAAYEALVAASAASDAVVRDANRPRHSAAVVAVDEQGNIAALLHTINAVTWGTTGIFVDGISIPDPASFQQDLIRRVGPGVRLPDPTNPFVVLEDGKPFLGASSIGSGLHENTVQSLINVLEYGMDPHAAVNRPQFLRPEWLATESRRQTVAEGQFPREILEAVRARGQDIREVPRSGTGLLQGYWIAARIDSRSGRRAAGFPTFALNGAAEGY